MKIFDIIAKIGNYYGFIVLLYLLCFTFLLIDEYKTNPEFADSIVCEEKPLDNDLLLEENDCDYIREMSRKGNNLFYWAMAFFILRFISEIILPNKEKIKAWAEEQEK